MGKGRKKAKRPIAPPPKNKPKKFNKAVDKQVLAAKTADKPVPVKHVVKNALKAGFKDNHVHNFPRILMKVSIELKGESPIQEFILSLQELLKNGQMVDKNFAFCLVKQDGGTKKIQDQSSIPTNMTLLSAHFKISSNKGRNPFEKQKVWKNNKEVKGNLRNSIIYFSMAITTGKEPEDLLARVSHESHWHGGIMLKVKDLQSFESETILCLFNVFTATNKKTVLAELCEVLSKAQELVQNIEPTEFFWDAADLPRNSTLPMLELCLMNPKTPGQDTSQYRKLSWRVQANRKVFHVECDQRFATDINHLAQLARDYKLVSEMWGKHTHVSEVVDKDSTPSKIKHLGHVAQVHCNYQCSMILEDVVSITNLNGQADLYETGMSTPLCFTLCKLLLQYVRLSDAHQLLAEIHQSSNVMGRVQAVIPNTPEAKQMVLMMN
jgi:hypothetical protein